MKSIQLFLKALLLLVIFDLPSMAQEEKNNSQLFFIGVHAAPTYTNSVWGLPEFKPTTGFVSGISGQCNFTRRWALHVELNYERSGYTVFDKNVYADITSPFYVPPSKRLVKSTYVVDNINFPVSMKYNFISKEKINVFLNAGTLINYIPSYRGVTEYGDGATQPFHEKFSFGNTWNHKFGLTVGLGTDITLCQQLHLTLEARATSCNHTSYGFFTGLTYQVSK